MKLVLTMIINTITWIRKTQIAIAIQINQKTRPFHTKEQCYVNNGWHPSNHSLSFNQAAIFITTNIKHEERDMGLELHNWVSCLLGCKQENLYLQQKPHSLLL